jgi:glutamyl-tRNA(Gln) amidotransferase subunit E
MPLIETVTHPQCLTPDELREAGEHIRFLNRSTGRVRTGMGAGREDVNVSCEGGTRVEIKGVAHNKWIPELSHNEAYRQWALLNIRKILLERFPDFKSWKLTWEEINPKKVSLDFIPAIISAKNNLKIIAIKLPGFHGILSHFTQPEKSFSDEISDRLKVIACIEKPNMTSTEEIHNPISKADIQKLYELMNAEESDAICVVWGPTEDIPTAIETVEERCIMAFKGVPGETRKSFPNGTTIFERVLPGADRMYPDTDSAPIPLQEEYIEMLRKRLPPDVSKRFSQLKEWKIPEDTYTYLMKRNLVPIIESLVELGVTGRFAGTFLGHKFKHIEGTITAHKDFTYTRIVDIFKYLKSEKLDFGLAASILPVVYKYPNMDFNSVLTSIGFKRRSKEELIAPIDYLIEKYKEIRTSKQESNQIVIKWVLGQLHKQALGNMGLKELRKAIEEKFL